jgi:hypothetical protein
MILVISSASQQIQASRGILPMLLRPQEFLGAGLKVLVAHLKEFGIVFSVQISHNQ